MNDPTFVTIAQLSESGDAPPATYYALRPESIEWLQKQIQNLIDQGMAMKMNGELHR